MSNSQRAERDRTGRRTALAVAAVAVVLLTSACGGERPYVASDGEADTQDQVTIDAVNAFIEANGGIAAWKTQDSGGDHHQVLVSELPVTDACSDRDWLGSSVEGVGDSAGVTFASVGDVVARDVLANAERVWSEYGIERRDVTESHAGTSAEYDGGEAGPTFSVSYGHDEDAASSMVIIADSVCRDFQE